MKYAISLSLLLAGCGDLGMEPLQVDPIEIRLVIDGKPVDIQVGLNGRTLDLVEKTLPPKNIVSPPASNQ
jgi:hypothetical protein